MTVKELKEVLDTAEPDWPVKVCVNTPAGWVCPDGCAIAIKSANHGIDWHTNEILIVPEFKLDIHDIEEWGRPQKEESEPKEKENPVESLKRFVRELEEAHKASAGSQMRFK